MMQNFWRGLLALYSLMATWLALRHYPLGLQEISDYKLQVIWFLPETSKARLVALANAGEGAIYTAYLFIETLSFTLVLVAVCVGIFWAMRQPHDKMRLPVRSTAILIAMLFLLYGMNAGLNLALQGLGARGVAVSLGLSAMPLYWMVGLIFSAAFTAHYVMLSLHDVTLFTKRVYASRLLSRSLPLQKAH
jgi:hypothetical protein